MISRLDEVFGDAGFGARAGLGSIDKRTGYALTLLEVVLQGEIDLGVRQLAIILLKQFAKESWDEDIASEDEKTSIKKEILRCYAMNSCLCQESAPGLRLTRLMRFQFVFDSLNHDNRAISDSESRIRTAAALAVSNIASHDWPEKWPTLVESLVHNIRTRSTMVSMSIPR